MSTQNIGNTNYGLMALCTGVYNTQNQGLEAIKTGACINVSGTTNPPGGTMTIGGLQNLDTVQVPSGFNGVIHANVMQNGHPKVSDQQVNNQGRMQVIGTDIRLTPDLQNLSSFMGL